jgi:hypothetical protein
MTEQFDVFYNDDYESEIMSNRDLQPAKLEDFFYWMNERHWIYVNRFVENKKKPWTSDKAMLEYKFTNVFRQLDTGTIALNKMLGKWFQSKMKFKDMDVDDAIDVLFNVVWYRMFNVAEHANALGFVKHKDHGIILKYLTKLRNEGKKVFTGAHMTSASGTVCLEHGKIYGSLLGAMRIAEEFGERMIGFIYHHQTMQQVTNYLLTLPMVGKFISYEIVCDLRFTPLLADATDKMTWVNIGPGAKRGLLRLGMEPNIESVRELYRLSIEEEMVEPHIAEHFPHNEFNYDIYPPFELREIEHSLCEFDKHQRIITGAGRSRSRYNGYPEIENE